MRKIIITLVLGTMFMSCKTISEEQVVTNVQEYKNGKFTITLNGWYEVNTNVQYRVGDTLKISKK